MTPFVPLLAIIFALGTLCAAYNVSPSTHRPVSRRDFGILTSAADRPVSRRDFGLLTSSSAAAVLVGGAQPTHAFEGSGSSAYTGKSATSKAELQKGYRARIAADVNDFNTLGNAIRKGETDGDAWVNFFIPYARREPDGVGRAYAALADLVGAPDRSGCGYLYAASFVKPGKPPENAPGVKKYNALAKSLEAIKADGKKGDAAKAQKDWDKASVAFSEFLQEVGMPASLSDDLYK